MSLDCVLGRDYQDLKIFLRMISFLRKGTLVLEVMK